MKKFGIILVFVLLTSIYYVSSAEVTKFTPIFCNDYEFTGCYKEKDYEGTKTLHIGGYVIGSHTDSWKCESNLYCEISNINRPIRVGSVNCREENPWYAGPRIVCDDDKVYTSLSYPIKIYPNYVVHPDYTVGAGLDITFNYVVYKKILKFSGRACGAGGVPVPGADGCTFTPKNGVIYADETMTNKKTGLVSYTVPFTEPSPTCIMSWVSGHRHICGYKEESCESDADCGGHTYGNKECYGRTLQVYGCRPYGTPISGLIEIPEGLLNPYGDTAGIQQDLPQPSSGGATFGKRCEIVEARPVQCCDDTDCGSGMFCDTTTFTCKETAECRVDADCGVSIQCDYVKKELKKPVCKNGKCEYETIKSVECCYDTNCPAGYSCGEDYKCFKRSVTIQECPFECCVNEVNYLDRPCPEEKPVCCADHTCAKSKEECKDEKVKEDCTNGIDDDKDGLIDTDDSDCMVCVIRETGEKVVLPPEECCKENKGIWVPPKEVSWFEKYFLGKKGRPGYCRIPHYPTYYILMLIAGIGLAYYGNTIWRKGERERGRLFLYLGLGISGLGGILLALAAGGFI